MLRVDLKCAYHNNENGFPAPAPDTATVAILMPKKNRIAIYELLFKEGVMVAKKDVHMPKHPELADKNVPNLHVMKAMQVAGAGGGGLFCWWSRQSSRRSQDSQRCLRP